MEIIQYPNPILVTKSEKIITIDTHVCEVASAMTEDLNKGILGMAAIQYGVPICLIGINMGGFNNIFLINPEILKLSDQQSILEEGCYSIDHGTTFYLIRRSKIVKVGGTDFEGNYRTFKFHNVYAHLLQHEIDHTNGILILDKIKK